MGIDSGRLGATGADCNLPDAFFFCGFFPPRFLFFSSPRSAPNTVPPFNTFPLLCVYSRAPDLAPRASASHGTAPTLLVFFFFWVNVAARDPDFPEASLRCQRSVTSPPSVRQKDSGPLLCAFFRPIEPGPRVSDCLPPDLSPQGEDMPPQRWWTFAFSSGLQTVNWKLVVFSFLRRPCLF